MTLVIDMVIESELTQHSREMMNASRTLAPQYSSGTQSSHLHKLSSPSRIHFNFILFSSVGVQCLAVFHWFSAIKQLPLNLSQAQKSRTTTMQVADDDEWRLMKVEHRRAITLSKLFSKFKIEKSTNLALVFTLSLFHYINVANRCAKMKNFYCTEIWITLEF